jgi:hypothetical protein
MVRLFEDLGAPGSDTRAVNDLLAGELAGPRHANVVR